MVFVVTPAYWVSWHMVCVTPGASEADNLLTHPVVAAQIHPRLPARRLLRPGGSHPAPTGALALSRCRDISRLAQSKVPHRKDRMRMWGAEG